MGAASVAVAVDPTIHTAHVISEGNGGSVSVIDETTGTLKSAAAPDHGLGIEPAGLAVDLPTHLVYVTFPSIGEVAAFAFDPSGSARPGCVASAIWRSLACGRISPVDINSGWSIEDFFPELEEVGTD